MAGYRPKSLDELNNIFDKTIAAEKAIKKSSSLIEKGEEALSSFAAGTANEKAAYTTAEKESTATAKRSEEISDSVSEFIAKFAAQAETEPVRAKPQMTVLTHEPIKKESEPEEAPAEKEAADTHRESEKPSRDELFNDYARIMADEDDDAPREKRLSRKEKKKLKKTSRQDAEPAVEKTEEASATEQAENITEAEESTEVAADNSTDEKEADEFDFPENYTPEWMKDDSEQETENEAPKTSVTKESKGARTAAKIILSIILVAVIGVSALATVLKTVVSVNTGKPVADKYYVFTADKAYEDTSIKEGSLVITENRDVLDDEIFAYVDYVSKTFEFGKRTDVITKEDGEIIYVTEKDGSRTLVLPADCRGVVHLTYEGYGRIADFLADNYIIIIAASAVAVLVIVLVFALGLRTKKEEDQYEEQEENSEESDEDFENIFSTIE